MESQNFFQAQLRACGQKITRHRLGILAVLYSSPIPLSAEDIYLRLNKEYSPISLSTVYRNLERMLADHLVVKQGLLEDKTQYMLKRTSHGHCLICLACQKVISIDHCPLESFTMQVQLKEGFQITDHRMELYGYCRECSLIVGNR